MSLKEVSVCDVIHFKEEINVFLESVGMECYSFLLGWYSLKVKKAFELPYHENTVAFTIISKPSMFEKCFIPFLTSEEGLQHNQDPLDQCMKKTVGSLKSLFPDTDLEIIHDFELTPSRRPMMLMQTAGHVCGAARFYQRLDLGNKDPWDKNEKIHGVSIHPRYGGWFAFRAVVIMKRIISKDMEPPESENLIKEPEDLINLLTLFNTNWKDGRYRDVIPVEEKYSDLQIQYFATPPSERHKLIQSTLPLLLSKKEDIS